MILNEFQSWTPSGEKSKTAPRAGGYRAKADDSENSVRTQLRSEQDLHYIVDLNKNKATHDKDDCDLYSIKLMVSIYPGYFVGHFN